MVLGCSFEDIRSYESSRRLDVTLTLFVYARSGDLRSAKKVFDAMPGDESEIRRHGSQHGHVVGVASVTAQGSHLRDGSISVQRGERDLNECFRVKFYHRVLH